MSISKEKFVRDMLMAQQARKCAEKEAEAKAIIENDQFSGYCNNKSYRGKKHSKPAYQC